MVKQVSSLEEYKSTISNSPVVVVDYFATWCGPCKMIAPKLEEFAAKYTKAVFLKVDVDELADVAELAQVRAMPTFHIFVKGQKVAEIVGADAKKLEAEIQKHAA